MTLAMPAPNQPTFWQQVRLNVVSWLIIAGVSGVGYISYTVPKLLQVVIANQEQLQKEAESFKGALTSLDRRVTVLELSK